MPLIIWNKKLFPSPRPIEESDQPYRSPADATWGWPASHRSRFARPCRRSFGCAAAGRPRSEPLLLQPGEPERNSVNTPLYFMTDDDPSRGLNQDNWTGIAYNSDTSPVISRA